MMATSQHHSATGHWSAQRVPLINGLGDTHIQTGEDYDTRPLGSFWRLAPTSKPKHQACAILPSLHHGYDAREHAAQRGQGQFVALVGDIDKGNHALSQVRGLVETFAAGSAWTIYSTASAVASERRWRVVMPLNTPVPFATWYDAQLALADHMTAAGIVMDTSAARPGQVAFLPNVPGDIPIVVAAVDQFHCGGSKCGCLLCCDDARQRKCIQRCQRCSGRPQDIFERINAGRLRPHFFVLGHCRLGRRRRWRDGRCKGSEGMADVIAPGDSSATFSILALVTSARTRLSSPQD